MEDIDLRAEVERRVRAHFQPAFEAIEQASPLTDEEKQARLVTMSPQLRQVIEENGWGQPPKISDERKEFMIRKDADELYAIVLERRVTSGVSGPLTEDELYNADMSRSEGSLNSMLTRLRAEPTNPIGEALIDMLEKGKEDLVLLRDNPTEELFAEVAERLVAQFRDFDVEGTIKRMKEHRNSQVDDQ
ncbi:MAG: hypothetical protein ABIV13_06760 [Fimbriimonadales bacterium]